MGRRCTQTSVPPLTPNRFQTFVRALRSSVGEKSWTQKSRISEIATISWKRVGGANGAAERGATREPLRLGHKKPTKILQRSAPISPWPCDWGLVYSII